MAPRSNLRRKDRVSEPPESGPTKPSQRRRAKGPTPDVDSSRERIHQAALRLLSRFGFEGMSMQMIADEVGLHKSTLFHHYRSKVDIALEVLDVSLRQVVETMAPLQTDASQSLEQLFSVSDDLVDFFFDEPDVAKLMLSSVVTPDDSDLRAPAEEGTPAFEFYSLLIGWLSAARDRGVIRSDISIRQAVFDLMGLFLNYPAAARMHGPLTGTDPLGNKARQRRKAMLRRTLQGMLAPQSV